MFITVGRKSGARKRSQQWAPLTPLREAGRLRRRLPGVSGKAGAFSLECRRGGVHAS